ncbi:hypothetical protein MDAP_001522 [Mitosporidium daphniae]
MVYPVKFVNRIINYPEAADFSTLKDEIHRLVSDELGIWSEIPSSCSSLLISKCAGGLSNIVLKVENHAQITPISILVRLFGTGKSMCSSRQRLETFWMSLLSEVGNCPKVLLEFANGRIETFLEDYFTLTLEDIRSDFYSIKIARELAAIHKQTDKILKGTVEFLDGNAGSLFTVDSILKDIGLLGNSFEQFFGSKYSSFNPFLLDLLGEICIYDEKFKGILHFITCTLREISKDQKAIVFIHGDLLNANIMASNSHPKRIAFIDYEYAGFGSRALDIANHFCEYMNCFATLEPYMHNYHLFPDDARIFAFINTYIRELDAEMADFALSEHKTQEIINEILFFSCVVSIRWTLWALFQFRMRIDALPPSKLPTKLSDIDNLESPFFYIAYAKYKFRHLEKLVSHPSRPNPILKVKSSLASGTTMDVVFPLSYLNF